MLTIARPFATLAGMKQPGRTPDPRAPVPAELVPVARRLIWWQPPAAGLHDLPRLVAQVMNLGTLADIRAVERALGEQAFGQVLDHPPPGVFTARRWNYWHVRLNRLPARALPARFEP